MSNSYTYYITHIPSGKIYHGVRYAKGCKPEDLWSTYFTSSRAIWNLIEQDGKEAFRFKVRKMFNSVEDAKAWQALVNRRIIGKPGVLNECSWPALSAESMLKSKISRNIIGEDGLTSAQRAGIKWKLKKNKINPETGVTYAATRKLRYNKSLDDNGSRETLSASSKLWHTQNENPTKRPEVRAKISESLKEAVASGRLKSNKGMKIPSISEKLKGNQFVKGYKWFNDGKKDVRLLPDDPLAQGLVRGRLLVKQKGYSYSEVICPHCGTDGAGGNMVRYHFDNCKAKSKVQVSNLRQTSSEDQQS